ncbi:MAG: RraA family protein [Nitrososphaerota archaeon]|nr:RraA family protein [Nitrososphaerota archaeon]
MSTSNDNEAVTPQLLAAFELLSTSTLSDAMDELKISCVVPGVFSQRMDQGRIAGFAMTAKFARVSHDDAAYRFGGGVGRPLEAVLQTMSSREIVVLDLGGATDASAWGGLASRLAMNKGVRGAVINGTCRDVEEIRGLGFPVWANGTCPRRSRNEFSFGTLREPVTIGDTEIKTGDIIVADATGVVRIPSSKATEVYETALAIAASEQKILGDIVNGTGVDWDQV